MDKKKALITGITGQDGSYLAELLLKKNYEVYGIIRRSSSFNTGRISHIYKDIHETENNLHLIYGDLNDSSVLNTIIERICPDEVYNLGAQSHVRVSFDIPEYTADIVSLGALRILEAVRRFQPKKQIKLYQASSSEMFGNSTDTLQNEGTRFDPQSPYACAKVFGYYLTKNYRKSYALFASNGILFNHESPRRGETFVTRKITRGLNKIKKGMQECLYLGNLDSQRDWGYAKDYAEAMWKILNHDKPDDFVIATGEMHSVRDFLELALKGVGIDAVRNGKDGIEEEYTDTKTGKPIVKIDKRYYRPSEVHFLKGDASKAKKILNWKPSVGFNELVSIMVESDRRLVEIELHGIKNL